MHWTVISPWMQNADPDQWFLQYLPGDQHSFTIIPYPYDHHWHRRNTKTTPPYEWKRIWDHVKEAEKNIGDQGGLLTLFPQRAAIAGLRKGIFRKKYPIVAWYFNIGKTYGGWKGALSRYALSHVDKLVVPSTWELRRYREWLDFPEEKFAFCRYQCPIIPVTEQENQHNPFLLALGSANRDFQTLFQAVEELGIRTVVVSSDQAIQGLRVPDVVEVNNRLSKEECLRLAQQARISIVPLADTDTASGHVTIVQAMAMQRPLIVTDCPGLSDYVEDRQTALTVQPHDVADLKRAIAELWEDEGLRSAIAGRAFAFAEKYCSDQAAAETLGKVLGEFAD